MLMEYGQMGPSTKVLMDKSLKKFNVSDGVGVAMARAANFRIALISGRYSAATEYHAEQLKIKDVYNGGLNKIPAYEELKKNITFLIMK